MKITRRKLARTVLAAAAVPASPQTAPAEDLMKTARDRLKAGADALARQQVPMSTEPAFQFKA